MVRIIENLMTWLRGLLEWIEEAKSAQPTKSNIRTYVKRSARWSGIATNVAQDASTRVAFFEVIAAAKNQPFLFADCIPEARKSASGSVYTPRDELNDFWYATDTGNVVGLTLTREMNDVSSPDPRIKRWTMMVSAPIGQTFWMDFIVVSTDEVDIEVIKR